MFVSESSESFRYAFFLWFLREIISWDAKEEAARWDIFLFPFAFSNISKPGSSFCARLAWLKMERIKKDTSKCLLQLATGL